MLLYCSALFRTEGSIPALHGLENLPTRYSSINAVRRLTRTTLPPSAFGATAHEIEVIQRLFEICFSWIHKK